MCKTYIPWSINLFTFINIRVLIYSTEKLKVPSIATKDTRYIAKDVVFQPQLLSYCTCVTGL